MNSGKCWTASVLFLLVLTAGLVLGPMALAAQSTGGEKSAPAKATIVFVSHCDMSQWFPDVSKLKWGLAMSTDEIVVEKEGDTKTYNQPAVPVPRLKKNLVLSDVPTGEKKTIEIEPGEYDWLILIDSKGDGGYPSHLGTTVRSVQQKKYNFEAGKTYNILVNPNAQVLISADETK